MAKRGRKREAGGRWAKGEDTSRISSNDILPILQKSKPLCALRAEIHKVAGEEEVVLWRHSHGVAHEGRGVECQSGGHAAGYPIARTSANEVVMGRVEGEGICCWMG